MEAYREASCIELYDPQIILRDKNGVDGFFDIDRMPAYVVTGTDIETLLAHYGLESRPVQRDSWSETQKRNIKVSDELALFHLQVSRRMETYNNPADKLEAFEDGSVLHIRVHGHADNDRWVEEISYRGAYSVHWVATLKSPDQA